MRIPSPLLATLPALLTAAGCHILTGEPVRSPADDVNVLHAAGADVDDTAAPGANDAGGAGGDCGCVTVGSWYRFDALKVTALDGGPHNAIGVLNSLWKGDIERHELNFFVRIEAVSDDGVVLKVVNGARLDGKTGEACALPYTETQVAVARAGCTLTDSTPTDLHIYAGTVSNKKSCAPAHAAPHTIAVREVVMRAALSADCSRIVAGKVVAGALPKGALEQTCICVNPGQGAEVCGKPDPGFVGKSCDGCNDKFQNLMSLLQNFQAPSWACAVDGEPAVCIEAEFSATRLDAGPPSCP